MIELPQSLKSTLVTPMTRLHPMASQPRDYIIFNKLAVVMVNGGLSTSMGMFHVVGQIVSFCDWRHVRTGSQG
jgi:hypothetical protein